MSLISAAELADHLGDPDLRIADVRWSLAAPAAGRAAYAEAHIPGRDLRRPGHRADRARRVPGAIPSPSRRRSRPPWARSASAGRTAWSPTTTRAGPSRPGCGGCSTSWGTRASRVLDGGIDAWRAAGLPLEASHPGVPGGGARRADRGGRGLAPDHRPRGAGAAARGGHPARRPGAGSAIAATWSRSTPSPATSRPRSARRRRRSSAPDGRFLVAAERCATGSERIAGRGRRRRRDRAAGRRLVRERRARLPARPRHAGRRPAGSPALPGLVLRLEPGRDADRDRRRARGDDRRSGWVAAGADRRGSPGGTLRGNDRPA